MTFTECYSSVFLVFMTIDISRIGSPNKQRNQSQSQSFSTTNLSPNATLPHPNRSHYNLCTCDSPVSRKSSTKSVSLTVTRLLLSI